MASEIDYENNTPEGIDFTNVSFGTNISQDTIALCLEVISGINVSITMPDGSTNLHAPEQARRFVTARQELIAARSSSVIMPTTTTGTASN
jgi:hypothetical protein